MAPPDGAAVDELTVTSGSLSDVSMKHHHLGPFLPGRPTGEVGPDTCHRGVRRGAIAMPAVAGIGRRCA